MNRDHLAAESRDIEVGTALLELEVPAHADGFFTRLEANLAAASPGLAPRRKGRLRYVGGGGLLAVAAGLTLVLALGGINSPGGSPAGPSPAMVATAADVGQLVSTSYTQSSSLSGVLVHQTPDSAGSSVQFTVSADGDFITRTTEDGTAFVTAYDAGTGVVTTLSQPAGGAASVTIQRNVDPALLPIPTVTEWLQRSVGSVAQVLLDNAQVPAATETYDGRPAWRMAVDVQPNLIGTGSPDRLDVTVDQQTRIPVHIVATAHGNLVYEDVLREVQVGAPTSRATFDVPVPSGAEVHELDGGFRQVPLSEVASVAGYAPLVPTDVPSGFELAEVAVAKVGQPTGPEGMNAPGENVVSLVYRHGFEVLRVQSWTTGATVVDDPLGAEGLPLPAEKVTLTGGALAGAPAWVVVAAPALPHLWAVNEGRVVVIAGDLSQGPAGGGGWLAEGVLSTSGANRPAHQTVCRPVQPTRGLQRGCPSG